MTQSQVGPILFSLNVIMDIRISHAQMRILINKRATKHKSQSTRNLTSGNGKLSEKVEVFREIC